ncbi:MAG: hypothetical protein JSW67_01055 [Candidatus Latescibacterota bacterium]|nr:MAG: hypothetical protein JSW67_01055 [Candidatus Latescibacterota bacterium]
MKGIIRCVALVLLIAAIPFAAHAGKGKSIGKDSGIIPAHLEEMPGSELKKVTFTADAAERVGLELDAVKEMQVPPKRKASGKVLRKVVPYASILYTPDGREWVYTSPENLTYVRHEIKIVYIDGDIAVLSEGPAAGTQVVTIGAAEVYGAEFEVGH